MPSHRYLGMGVMRKTGSGVESPDRRFLKHLSILSATRIDCDLPSTTKSRSKGALAKTPQLSMNCTARAFVERANRARDAGVKTKRPAMALVVLGAPYTWPGMGLLLCPYRPGVSSHGDDPRNHPESPPSTTPTPHKHDLVIDSCSFLVAALVPPTGAAAGLEIFKPGDVK